MQIITITLLLCVATAFGYGNVEVNPTESIDKSILDNSVHGDDSQFHGGYAPSEIAASETPTTHSTAAGHFGPAVDANGENVPHMEPAAMPLPYEPHAFPTRMPHQFPTHSHRYNGFGTVSPNPMGQFHPNPMGQFHPHPMAFPYYAPQPFWFNRYNGFGMQRPMPNMMTPYFQRFGFSPAQSRPMPPLIIVKLLQPIVLPIARNVPEAKSPKAEVEIDTARINHNGMGQGFNRFGQANNYFGQGFNRFGQGFHGFGQGNNYIGQRFNRFGQGFHGFGQGNNNFGQGFNRFGQGFHGFGQGYNGFGQGFNRFGQFNNMGHGMNNFGMNRFGQGFNRFAQGSNNVGQGFAGFGPNGFMSEKLRMAGHQAPFRQNTFGSYKMNEDQDLHITVKLN